MNKVIMKRKKRFLYEHFQVQSKLALNHASVQLPTLNQFCLLQWLQPHGVSNLQGNEPRRLHDKHERRPYPSYTDRIVRGEREGHN